MNKIRNNSPLISIAIPIYNGESTLSNTLENILVHHTNDIEIVLCDDNSSDNTYDIAMSYSQENEFIKVYRNDENIGMDRNFLKSAVLSSGEYIWFFGQDDELYAGAIKRVVKIIKCNKDIGILYLNYDQYNHDMTKIINKSFIKVEEEEIKKYLINENEYKFISYEDYFKYMNDIPTFLPATIINRGFLRNTDLTPFYGTNYIQVALMYLNMHKGSLYVIMDQMIKGRIPNDKWQNNGNFLFNVMTGFLKMQKISLQTKGCKLPKKVYWQKRKNYLLNYLFHIRLCKARGLKPDKERLGLLYFVFNDTILYYIYLLPLTFLPLSILNVLCMVLRPVKKSILWAFGLDYNNNRNPSTS